MSDKNLDDLESCIEEKVMESMLRVSNKRSKNDEVEERWRQNIEDTISDLKENKDMNCRMDDLERRMEEKSKRHEQRLEQISTDFGNQMSSMNTLVQDNHNKQTRLSRKIMDSIDNIEAREDERIRCQAQSFEDMKHYMGSLFHQYQTGHAAAMASTGQHPQGQLGVFRPETPRSIMLGQNFQQMELQQTTQATSETEEMGIDEENENEEYVNEEEDYNEDELLYN